MVLHPRISGDELRGRIKRLGMTYTEAAERLGLTLDGLNKQMRDVNPVSRQTELLLGYLEKYPPPRRVRVNVTVTKIPLGTIERRVRAGKPGKPRRPRSLAKHLS